VTLTSATSDVCNTLAALAETSYQDYFTAGLLTVLQARAAALTCLECRPECQAGVACTSL
jgi:hypothetical protein